MYHWEFDGPAQQEFAALAPTTQVTFAAFMDAVVILDPIEYQRRPDEVGYPLAPLDQVR
jgi:hypothetical protein